MKDLENIYINKKLQRELSYFNQEASPCHGIENVSIIVHKKKMKKRNKFKLYKYAQQQEIALHSSGSRTLINKKFVSRHSSMPELNKRVKSVQPKTRSYVVIPKMNNHPFKSKFIVNLVSKQHFQKSSNPFNYPSQTKWKIYRCQLSTAEDSCCCSCNSDAMFEVMKSLYDCYKKKDCNDCDCILCGHIHREERRLGELRKSLGAIPSEATPSAKDRKEKIKKAEKLLQGKTPAEKERILRDIVKSKQPLPEGKTPSEKSLIKIIRTEAGLPPEPKSATERALMRKAEAAGIITPLEGKTAEQKEKNLKAQAAMGIELPEGRTPSEKALIHKVKTAAGIPVGIPSEKLRKARAAGLITPLEGKTPEQKEKILRGLAMEGLPLPEGKTPSEKKLVDKVRVDLGLPPEPKNKAMRDRYTNAINAGLLQPLEGKSPREKERILQGLADLGIPLPEGRTPSEKSLVAKVKARSGPPLSIVAPSEKMRRVQAAGLLTPLEGKTPEQKEKILKGLAMHGMPLPEGKTLSERKLIDKVRAEVGLPPEPKTKSMKDKYERAANVGLLQPLEGKTPAQKEKILKGLHDMGIPLPEGRTASEKSLIAKVKAGPRAISAVLAPSEKIRRAKAAGLLTPLEGKTPEEKQKILTGLAMVGLPLPEGKTASEKKLINKVRADLGLPPEPKSKFMRDKYEKAANAGLLQPLEGKSPKEKRRILQGLHDMGIPLPEGRTASEKSIIAKLKASPGPPLEKLAPSERMRRAKAEGIMTPLEGKTPDQKENIIKGLAMHGLPLPEGKTSSEKKLIDKVRAELGMPPEPTNPEMKEKYNKAAAAGLLQPLEGKTSKQKEQILTGLHNMGIPLPDGRTASEKSLIAKVKARPPVLSPSEKKFKAKAAGFLTPLAGKTPEQKEKILKGLAMAGMPLPEGKTVSERKLIDKVRADLGMPPEPKNQAMRKKYEKAADAGLLQPLEGKSPKEKERILTGLRDMGIPLPEGRTPSEKSLINRLKASPILEKLAPSERMRRAKAEGLITPLEGKTPQQKEQIVKGLAMHGLPLPEGKTSSEKKIINRVRAELGMPPEPTTPDMKDKYAKAAAAGLLQPLEGKTPAQKEQILTGLHNMGIPLPEGRTASEKSLIAKVKARPIVSTPSEKQRRAKAAGLLTPLQGKTPAQKETILKGLAMHGIPLPEGKTASERKLLDKVRTELGLPPEPKSKHMKDKYSQAADAGFLQPLEGKSPAEKEQILQGLHDLGIPLPEGRTPSERSLIARVKSSPGPPLEKLAPSERMRRAKAEGLITPLEGKAPEKKENILKGLAMHGLPLPESKTPSQKKLIDKVRTELGLPPEPSTPEMKEKYAKAASDGLLQPLEGKTPKQKEQILQGLHDLGIPLPEGRTASEKSLIAKVSGKPRVKTPSERKRLAKAAGLLTPLEGKTPDQQEKILKGLAMHGIPLPDGKTTSEKKMINKVRAELGLPPEPKTQSMKDKYAKAADAGLLQPLEGKTPKEKERILQGLHNLGIPLPEGRTASEKAMVAAVKERPRALSTIPPASERLRRAKAAGLITPLEGKTPDQKEKILKGLAMHGIALPEGKTSSEKKLIDKVRADMGLPPEPKTQSMKEKYAKAADAGLLQPLEGKSPQEKERILQGLHDLGIPLPEGRTPSEKALVSAVKARPRAPSAILAPSERMRRAKAAGLITPLAGKTPEQKEKIIKGLAMHGIPLPEGKTSSEKKLIDKVRAELGLPPEPKTQQMKDKYAKAADAGLLQPLEGKSPKEKERILQGLHNLGIPLPEGRTASEKAMVAAVKARPRALSTVPPASERLRRAKAAGLITPLEGKTPDQKEKILKGLAMHGIALPEGKTSSEKKLIDKVRADMGLPPEPKTQSMKEKYAKAADAGLLQPLEGKSPQEKERILQGLHDLGIPLPEGRTPSEKALVSAVKARPRAPSAILAPSERMRRAKAAGLITPLAGKTPEQKEKIIKGLAMHGIPLPEGKTSSEKKLIDKVRAELGLPPEPKTQQMKDKYAKAADAGLLQPLEGKSPKEKERILQGLHNLGIPLPEGRTASEKAMVAAVKARPRALSTVPPASERFRRAKAAGLITPLEGKTPDQKEKILKGLAMHGIALPEGKTSSEKKLIDKVRADMGLPPEPKTQSMKEKYAKAADAGLLQPLEGKSPQEKERILQGLHDLGIPLPEGRTPSEKALVSAVKSRPRAPSAVLAPSERMRRAKADGLITPLAGKTPEQKEKIIKGLAMHGIPLPEGKTSSEKKLIDKVRAELGLPPEPKTQQMKDKYAKAADAGLLQPLEGKSPKEKERILQGLHNLGIPLPEGRTASEKAMVAAVKARPRALSTVPPASERFRRAKAAGLITPLEGKTPDQKEKILKGLAMHGIALPEGKTSSEKKLIDKVRADMGLPPEPKTQSMKEKYAKAADAGLLQPLEGKSPQEKERILQGLHDLGIPLPEGRTPSEKALVSAVKSRPRAPSAVLAPSERMRRAKADGLITPPAGKTPEQKEKIIKGLAMHGIPLPEGKTSSEKKLIDKVRAELGLPPEPKTQQMKDKYAKAADAGLLQPLEGKSPKEKERILQGLHNLGIPLPEGRTASEKAMVATVKARPRALSTVPPASERLRRAKAAGLITPLEGKTPDQKEKILKGLAMHGIALPEGKTSSEKKLIDKVRADMGLPPEPKTQSMKEKYAKAADAGLLQPLEGKSPQEKERILQGLHDLGIPLPEGRTPSEKALVSAVKSRPRAPSAVLAPSERMRRAKAEGLITPLAGKTPEQKEKIIKGLAMHGIPLPEGKTSSEKKLIDKVRAELGLPPEPKTEQMKDKYAKAADAGLLQPLEGKSPKEKERILQGLHNLGIPLPEGRTASEKAMVAAVKARPRALSTVPPASERLRRAKAAGLITPLEGKTSDQKEKILKGLAMHGIALPEGKTSSEKKLIDKVRADMGLPPEPKTQQMKEKYAKAADAGLLQPLEGKSPKEKERILQGLHNLGIPLPEGRTASEKALVAAVKARPRALSTVPPASERMRRAKAAGLITPLEGKTPEQKEKILKGLAMHGISLPQGKTPSEKKLVDKVRAEMGLPPEPKTPEMKEKYALAADAGLLQPLEGKSPKEKERILKGLADMGIPLPEGRTSSEKALIAKVKAKAAASITTDKIQKAKAAGLLTPLAGKSPEQREKILKGLAKAGLPLPEGRTLSEKAIVNKVKKELGIPDRTPSEKLRKAKMAGLLTPLEDKTPAQKEKILRGRAAAGLPLPEGRTPSERALIQKIKDDTGFITPSPSERLRKAKAAGILTPLKGKTPSMKEKIINDMLAAGVPIPEGETPSEKELIKRVTTGAPPPKTLSAKLRQAKAAGLLTPLLGKSPDQKKKILKGLIKAGVPLPEPKTASEKDLMDKVREEAGLPPEPKTPSLKEKYRKAQAAGIITPLDGKTKAEKAKILKQLHDAGIPLPEGRTTSEKSMIKRVKAGLPPKKTISEKMKAAKAAGLMTPLEGKTPAQKEKILRGLAKAGVPLPEGKTSSEKDLINKVRTEMGLPPEPKSPSIKEKMRKAHADGIITPLEGKSSAQKEKILKALAEAGIPLPEGRTRSEKSLINKVKAETVLRKIPSEKFRKAKAAGLLTPLEGKSPEQKEKIIKGLAELGLPLPLAKTASEKKLVAKIRKDLGLPPEPKTPSMRERHEKAAAAGVLVPLQGLSPTEKEKVLKAQAALGLPLPEGRTPSEKSLIAKVKADTKRAMKTPSEKLRSARVAGLLTPLEGKPPEEKEKIMRGLAEHGLPLPEAKTESEQKLAAKIRKELGLPPEPKTPSMKERYAKAAAAGVLLPLEGLTPTQKENVLKSMAEHGIPLPEGRTPSEKALIAKVKAEQEPSKIPSEKLRKAKAAGLLTPLAGKTPAEKERIIRGLAESGLPLPEGKTTSEKSLIHKIRTELGIPPPAKTPSEKAIIRKAKADGLFTPLTGKSPAQKENILRGLAEAGLPLPVGKTASEKALIKKVRAEVGLPLEPTPSEKAGKIKTKSKKVGISETKKKLGKGIAAEEFEDIIKTTTCDRGCGCDKKKIRFKHSYVKIRVTSPDISSLCDCPQECLPGVKAGAFIDNEGIKVTVGSAVGVPSYSREFSSLISEHIHNKPYDELNLKCKTTPNDRKLKTIFNNKITCKPEKLSSSLYEVLSSETYSSCYKINNILNTTSSDKSCSSVLTTQYDLPYTDSENDKKVLYYKQPYGRKADERDTILDHIHYETSGDVHRDSISKDHMIMDNSSRGSFDSILFIKTESSLSFTSSSNESMDTVSVMSFANSSVTTNSTHYYDYQFSDDIFSNSSTEESQSSSSKIEYDNLRKITSDKHRFSHESSVFTLRTENQARAALGINKHDEYFIFRMSQTGLNSMHRRNGKSTHNPKSGEPIVVINHLNSESDITTMVDELLSKNTFSGASSIFVVVPSDDNDAEMSSDGRNSTICIQLSENHTKWNYNHPMDPNTTQRRNSNVSQGVKISSKGKKYFMEGLPTTILSSHNKKTMFDFHQLSKACRKNDKTKNKLCQITTPNEVVQIVEQKYNVVSTDTTADRPCCCPPKASQYKDYSTNDRYVANVTSKQITPLLVKQGMEQQASYLSVKITPTPVTPCRIPPCGGHPPVNIPVQEIKKDPRTQPCQCSPEKLRELLEQAIKAGKTANMKSVGCGEAGRPSIPKAPAPTKAASKGGNCSTCLHPTHVDECQCSATRKMTITKPQCPCEEHQPRKITDPGLKSGPDNIPCPTGPYGETDQTMQKTPGLTCPGLTVNIDQAKAIHQNRQAIGPAGESLVETGGIYTQVGTKQTRFSSSIGTYTEPNKDCVCNDKHGKKKKKIKCECPKLEPEPEPEPIEYATDDFEWYDEAEFKKMKSGMTETTSGFTFDIKKRPTPEPMPQDDYSLDDAIRYYASMKPDLFRDIIEDQQNKHEHQNMQDRYDKHERHNRRDDNTNKKTVDCECPFEPESGAALPESLELEENQANQEEAGPFKGLKIKMGGKGSGSPGLTGICCFDMLQESFTAW